MRSVESIKEMKNKLNAKVSQISNEVKSIRQGRPYSQLQQDDLKVVMELSNLAKLYIHQIKALSFVLNEESEIIKYEGIRRELVEEFIIE